MKMTIKSKRAKQTGGARKLAGTRASRTSSIANKKALRLAPEC